MRAQWTPWRTDTLQCVLTQNAHSVAVRPSHTNKQRPGHHSCTQQDATQEAPVLATAPPLLQASKAAAARRSNESHQPLKRVCKDWVAKPTHKGCLQSCTTTVKGNKKQKGK